MNLTIASPVAADNFSENKNDGKKLLPCNFGETGNGHSYTSLSLKPHEWLILSPNLDNLAMMNLTEGGLLMWWLQPDVLWSDDQDPLTTENFESRICGGILSTIINITMWNISERGDWEKTVTEWETEIMSKMTGKEGDNLNLLEAIEKRLMRWEQRSSDPSIYSQKFSKFKW